MGDLKTNVSGNASVRINIFGNTLTYESKVITFDKRPAARHSSKRSDGNHAIVITREGMIMGKAKIKIGEPLAAVEAH